MQGTQEAVNGVAIASNDVRDVLVVPEAVKRSETIDEDFRYFSIFMFGLFPILMENSRLYTLINTALCNSEK